MTMNAVQQNIAVEIQNLGKELVRTQMQLTALNRMWVNEGMSSLTDADLAEYPQFAHVTAAEFTDAAIALVAINTTMGTSDISNWAKLIKILDTVPK